MPARVADHVLEPARRFIDYWLTPRIWCVELSHKTVGPQQLQLLGKDMHGKELSCKLRLRSRIHSIMMSKVQLVMSIMLT